MLIIQRPTVEAIGEAEDNRQRFAVGPLDPGFGHTLGNSLRRTLLSSIPGASVTQVRFDEALHEFTTLPGVKEDITDLLLNLKDVLFKVHSDEPVTIRLDKRGPGDATAGDIQVSADVEVLSPAQHIASLNAKGRLAVDLTVERGRGYSSADKNKRSSVIGVIPSTPSSPPVRRVAFTVEPVRVEQSTDFDRLVLDIETDGSLTPVRRWPRPATRCAPWSAWSPTSRTRRRAWNWAKWAPWVRAHPTSISASRTWTSPSGPGTASSGPRSTPSASWSTARWTTC